MNRLDGRVALVIGGTRLRSRHTLQHPPARSTLLIDVYPTPNCLAGASKVTLLSRNDGEALVGEGGEYD